VDRSGKHIQYIIFSLMPRALKTSAYTCIVGVFLYGFSIGLTSPKGCKQADYLKT